MRAARRRAARAAHVGRAVGRSQQRRRAPDHSYGDRPRQASGPSVGVVSAVLDTAARTGDPFPIATHGDRRGTGARRATLPPLGRCPREIAGSASLAPELKGGGLHARSRRHARKGLPHRVRVWRNNRHARAGFRNAERRLPQRSRRPSSFEQTALWRVAGMSVCRSGFNPVRRFAVDIRVQRSLGSPIRIVDRRLGGRTYGAGDRAEVSKGPLPSGLQDVTVSPTALASAPIPIRMRDGMLTVPISAPERVTSGGPSGRVSSFLVPHSIHRQSRDPRQSAKPPVGSETRSCVEFRQTAPSARALLRSRRAGSRGRS